MSTSHMAPEGREADLSTENERLRAAQAANAERFEEMAHHIVKLEKALRNIAEGNLGDMPWQAGYDRIREVARAAIG
jgi:hypothetical protein